MLGKRSSGPGAQFEPFQYSPSERWMRTRMVLPPWISTPEPCSRGSSLAVPEIVESWVRMALEADGETRLDAGGVLSKKNGTPPVFEFRFALDTNRLFPAPSVASTHTL